MSTAARPRREICYAPPACITVLAHLRITCINAGNFLLPIPPFAHSSSHYVEWLARYPIRGFSQTETSTAGPQPRIPSHADPLESSCYPDVCGAAAARHTSREGVRTPAGPDFTSVTEPTAPGSDGAIENHLLTRTLTRLRPVLPADREIRASSFHHLGGRIQLDNN